jgi:hypothetical protein
MYRATATFRAWCTDSLEAKDLGGSLPIILGLGNWVGKKIPVETGIMGGGCHSGSNFSGTLRSVSRVIRDHFLAALITLYPAELGMLPTLKNDFTKNRQKKVGSGCRIDIISTSRHRFTASRPVLSTSHHPLSSCLFVMCHTPLIIKRKRQKRSVTVGIDQTTNRADSGSGRARGCKYFPTPLR